MKKLLIALGMMFALSACSEKEVANKNEKLVEAPKTEIKVDKKNIINQFEYQASKNVSVSITEIVSDFDQTCVIAHANYKLDKSQADISCIPRMSERIFKHDKNEIIKQFTYNENNSPTQVTMIKTRNNQTCIIAHANYMYDTSTAKISCV